VHVYNILANMLITTVAFVVALIFDKYEWKGSQNKTLCLNG